MLSWNKAQESEAEWWGGCFNTYGEERKQIIYAGLMGLEFKEIDGIPYQIDISNKKILDIGGGPSSLLLKTFNRNKLDCMVVDPCKFPDWVSKRYYEAGIYYINSPAEVYLDNLQGSFDEIWIYNVLQHVINPGKIITCARKLTKTIRIFEWINAGTNEAHLHNLTGEYLNFCLSGSGLIVDHKGESGCSGTSYSGCFQYE